MVSTILPLTLADAQVRRRGKRIVGPVDLVLEAGDPTLILGPNGSGKTTLLRLMHGIERLAVGTAFWSLDRREADLRQSFVFQTPILLRRTVFENVSYPLKLRGETKPNRMARATEMLTRVGLQDAANRPASSLSGGERQKLALARALITRPEVLFLDEPTASLDGKSTREIEAILSTSQQAGVKIIMATHDLGQARRLASEILFLHSGRVIERSPARAFFEMPSTPEANGFVNGDIVE